MLDTSLNSKYLLRTRTKGSKVATVRNNTVVIDVFIEHHIIYQLLVVITPNTVNTEK